MIINDLLGTVGDFERKKLEKITICVLAEKLCAAVTLGVVAGIIFGLKLGKKKQAELRSAGNTMLTIEVHDLEKLKIERVEKINEGT